jgi:perosamine synthetase
VSEGTTLKRVELIPWAKPTLSGNEQIYVSRALSSTWISGGPFIERFEAEFGRLCGVPFATTASNGTAAIHMALLALGIGPGDEVIVPGFAFMAAANVALHVGARPVFTEVDPATWCMTAKDVESKLSAKTKLIIPVHTYGNVCDMDEIMPLANKNSIPVLEDAAEAFLSRFSGCYAGVRGALGTFSFHATKTITTGEGGMVVTSDPEMNDRLFLYRNHGMLRTRYWHELPGHNFRMTNMQAALGCAQLETIDQITVERKRIYDSYHKYLSNIPGVKLQRFAPGVEAVVWAVALTLDPRNYPQGRDTVMRELQEAGIETRNGFYAASMLHHLYGCPELPICEDLARRVISLPTYCTLSDSDIEFICSVLDGLRK